MDKNISWSIGIMCYNEVSSLESVVDQTDSVLSQLSNDYEIIIIDDNSSDGSSELADKLAEKYASVKVVHHKQNKGIGEVLYTAYTTASKDWFNVVPADGEFFPKDLIEGRKLMEEGVVVSYTHTKLMSFNRRLISFFQRTLNLILFGIEIQRPNWIKIMPMKPIREMNIISRSPAIETEVVVRLLRKGYKFIEIPSYNIIKDNKTGGMNLKLYLIWIITSIVDSFKLWQSLKK